MRNRPLIPIFMCFLLGLLSGTISACGMNQSPAATICNCPTVSPCLTASPQPTATLQASPSPTLWRVTPTFAPSPTAFVTKTPPPVLPNAGTLVFVNYFSRSNGIYVMRFPKIVPQNITKPFQTRNFKMPSWSPDGKWIAYAADSDYPAGMLDFDIYVIRSDGQEFRRLTYGGYSWDPAWSPDGNWIAFISNEGLYRIHPNGTGAQALSNSNGLRALPTWSPDGRYIAYLLNTKPTVNDGSDLMVFDTQTWSDYPLALSVDREPSRLSWSPDGKTIYFHKGRGCGKLYSVENNHRMSFPLPVEGVTENIYSVSWSPDGKWMAYIADDHRPTPQCIEGGGQLFVAEANWKNPVRIDLDATHNPHQVVWAPTLVIP